MMFSASRNSVVNSSIEGKVEKASARGRYSDSISITVEIAMFVAMKPSVAHPGIGMIIRPMIITTSNARIAADDTNAGKMLKMVTSNGSISAVNVSAPKFIAHTSNGSIKVQGINSGEITIATANGSIAGTIPGRMEDYAITSKTSNGKNNLPNGTAGAKKLDVRTSNGSISVDFAG